MAHCLCSEHWWQRCLRCWRKLRRIKVVLEDNVPRPFSQKELNDLVRDLSLLKGSTGLLASRLKGKKSALRQCSYQLLRQQASTEPPFFPLQWRVWCTVQILCSCYSSLGCQSTNSKIKDCSLTAASYHCNLFCYTTATSLPQNPSLTWLN